MAALELQNAHNSSPDRFGRPAQPGKKSVVRPPLANQSAPGVMSLCLCRFYRIPRSRAGAGSAARISATRGRYPSNNFVRRCARHDCARVENCLSASSSGAQSHGGLPAPTSSTKALAIPEIASAGSTICSSAATSARAPGTATAPREGFAGPSASSA
jgi:hypothetical protein